MGLISRVSSRTYRRKTCLFNLKMGTRLGGTGEGLYKFEDEADNEGKVNQYPALTARASSRIGYDNDPRFNMLNRARECHANYTHFFQCEWVMKDRGNSTAPCQFFKKQYLSACSPPLVRYYDDLRNDGYFAGPLYLGMEKNASPGVNRTTTHQERYAELLANPRYQEIKDQL